MTIPKFTGLALAALLVAGCGGGDNLREERDALQAELEETQKALDEATAEAVAATRAAQEAAAETQRAKADAAAAEQQKQEDVAAARTAGEQAGRQEGERAAAAARAAQQAAERETASREASQRAQHLRDAFGTPTVTPTASPVTITAQRGRLKLERSGFSPATLSGSGLRSATMALITGGDTGKTVVYTDRELSRPLLKHFGDQLDSTDMTRFILTPGAADTSGALGLPAAIPTTSKKWKVTHGFPTSVGDDPDNTGQQPDTPDTKMADFYAGLLHGLPGRFVCAGDGCQVQVAPTYETTPGDNGRFALASVGVTATGTGSPTLHFKPNGDPSIQLYEGGPVGPDVEYMQFGFWRENPRGAAANYHVGVFAEAINGGATATFPSGATATYDGTAVGMYVEHDPNDPIHTHRQGEFVADVRLDATDSTISGTIEDFVTTPTEGSVKPRTAGRWIVTLQDGGTAHITSLPGAPSGAWEHSYVAPHAYAADEVPPAVTGTFNTRIPTLIHILGAFGAEKR